MERAFVKWNVGYPMRDPSKLISGLGWSITTDTCIGSNCLPGDRVGVKVQYGHKKLHETCQRMQCREKSEVGIQPLPSKPILWRDVFESCTF